MPDMFVKICGLRELAAARVAVDAGASAIGFILAEGKRKVSPAAIRAIRDELGFGSPPFVGVTVNHPVASICRLRDQAGIDIVQLSGDEDPSILADLDLPAIKALRFPVGTPLDVARIAVDAWLSARTPALYVIVEGHTSGAYGGTGNRADWELATSLAAEYPIVLAGGLTPENVGEAVTTVQPFGVDVSSGVEIVGRKNPERIAAFIEHARRAADPL